MWLTHKWSIQQDHLWTHWSNNLCVSCSISRQSHSQTESMVIIMLPWWLPCVQYFMEMYGLLACLPWLFFLEDVKQCIWKSSFCRTTFLVCWEHQDLVIMILWDSGQVVLILSIVTEAYNDAPLRLSSVLCSSQLLSSSLCCHKCCEYCVGTISNLAILHSHHLLSVSIPFVQLLPGAGCHYHGGWRMIDVEKDFLSHPKNSVWQLQLWGTLCTVGV